MKKVIEQNVDIKKLYEIVLLAQQSRLSIYHFVDVQTHANYISIHRNLILKVKRLKNESS